MSVDSAVDPVCVRCDHELSGHGDGSTVNPCPCGCSLFVWPRTIQGDLILLDRATSDALRVMVGAVTRLLAWTKGARA